MPKRLLLLALVLPLHAAAPDILQDRLNRFAQEYNNFVREYHLGVVDSRAQRNLSREWRGIEGCGEWAK